SVRESKSARQWPRHIAVLEPEPACFQLFGRKHRWEGCRAVESLCGANLFRSAPSVWLAMYELARQVYRLPGQQICCYEDVPYAQPLFPEVAPQSFTYRRFPKPATATRTEANLAS